MGLIDTAALQCVGLVIFLSLGVLGYLSTRDGADAMRARRAASYSS